MNSEARKRVQERIAARAERRRLAAERAQRVAWLPIFLEWLEDEGEGDVPLDFEGNPIPKRLAELLQRAFGTDADPSVIDAADVFRAAWHSADKLGQTGHRVEAGLRALIAAGWIPPIVVQPCPECRDGKHVNCDGIAWDFVRDEAATCPCSTAGHGAPC